MSCSRSTTSLRQAYPTELFRSRKQEISPQVGLLHDYPLWEQTIAVRAGE
jgi:hypothetical protein